MGGQARILVVDDDEDIRKVLKTVLEGSGYVVETARSGKEAIRKSKSFRCNVVLLDVRLSDIAGTELLTRLRETTPRMRKVIMTGYPTLQNAVEAVNGGADAYMMKPLEMENVLKTIKEQLRAQEKEIRYSQEKVTDFVETRVRELEQVKKIPRQK